MALKYSYHGVIDGNTHMNKWWITPKNRNTYGVETCICYTIFINPYRGMA
ncbi:MAG: hypothetical protein HXO13_05760 [Prevotella salivae]|nr:hypothetical protein [Segatella salivae]